MILVTGAAGFIGKHLLSALLPGTEPVIPLFRSKTAVVEETRWGADLTRKDHLRELAGLLPQAFGPKNLP